MRCSSHRAQHLVVPESLPRVESTRVLSAWRFRPKARPRFQNERVRQIGTTGSVPSKAQVDRAESSQFFENILMAHRMADSVRSLASFLAFALLQLLDKKVANENSLC
jgi:hypothetical protein